MNPSITVALISAGASIVTAIIALVNGKMTRSDIINNIERHNDVVDEKIANLTKQVEKHNSVIERMFIAEVKIETLEKEVDKLNASAN